MGIILEGNPIRKKGWFVVDEERQLFYLLSSECYDFFYGYMCDESLVVYSFENK